MPEERGGVVVMAHRGLSAAVTGGPHDENSLAAFARAVALGATHLETDVRVTSDGVALAFHDAVLDRVTDARGIVAHRPWARVREARIGGVEPIPTLEDVLGSFPDAVVNIDVKSDAGVAPTLAALERTGAHDRVCLAAFSDRRLARLRAALPHVRTAMGPAEIARLRLVASPGPVGGVAAVLPRGRGVVAQVPRRAGLITVVDRRFVQAAHRLGVEVQVWTVNDPWRMEQLLDLGVDGLITDRVDLAIPLVRARAAA
ncbi:glycerophosphodiester phosphodiesterase family protein [Jatrophihabitans sp. YIM 134969]